MSGGGSGNYGKSSGSSQSRPLTPGELQQYYAQLDVNSAGRLGQWAQQGTTPLTEDQIKAVGGLGETRRVEAQRAREDAIQAIVADPSLTLSQRQRSQQLTGREYADRLDAIAKESEAAKTALARENNNLTREDLQLLANIFYGGKGQISNSKSSSLNLGGSGYGGVAA